MLSHPRMVIKSDKPDPSVKQVPTPPEVSPVPNGGAPEDPDEVSTEGSSPVKRTEETDDRTAASNVGASKVANISNVGANKMKIDEIDCLLGLFHACYCTMRIACKS